MALHQYLIGGVALVIGGLSLAAAVSNHDHFFQLAKLRILEDLLGRNGARVACAVFGCGLIVVGGLIVAGVLPRRMSQSDDRLEAYPTEIA